MLYLIENRNQSARHLTDILNAINPLVIFTTPSLPALELLRPHVSTGPVHDYTAVMELAPPFSTPAAAPKLLDEAGLAHYALVRQAGNAPYINESTANIYHRVERWFKLWRPDWDQTPTVPVVIFVDPPIFHVLHAVIDSNTPGRREITKGPYGSIMVYENDGWLIETRGQLQ